ncbi:MAG TPA: hypothetical protein PKA42_03570 [Candidatus Paceibacterota bacterium]|nr:hypothetical protein [Candidatus Paceibacterota bacterium]HMO83220.1 hypothetical protein [Candidatus Paceibacterota bacterium]
MPQCKKYDRAFFKEWTPDMAYILGFLYADGNIVETKRGNYYIAIYSADELLLKAMRRAMKSEHKIAGRHSTTGSVYRIQIGSTEWFSDLVKLGLTPNKSRRMTLPSVPAHFFGDFVRGYFDGDGNVWVGFVHKERKTALKVIQVAFTSGSAAYLKSLHLVLKQHGISGGSLYQPKSGNYARLALSVSDALKLYKIMYNSHHKLYLKRKKSVFEEFVKLRS